MQTMPSTFQPRECHSFSQQPAIQSEISAIHAYRQAVFIQPTASHSFRDQRHSCIQIGSIHSTTDSQSFIQRSAPFMHTNRQYSFYNRQPVLHSEISVIHAYRQAVFIQPAASHSVRDQRHSCIQIGSIHSANSQSFIQRSAPFMHSDRQFSFSNSQSFSQRSEPFMHSDTQYSFSNSQHLFNQRSAAFMHTDRQYLFSNRQPVIHSVISPIHAQIRVLQAIFIFLCPPYIALLHSKNI